MHLQGYYSSGQFARLASVSVRTIRFYDQQNILKPSYVSDSGARFYTDKDLARLQQILLLKYLGFSLEDIKKITVNDADWHFMLTSLNLQKNLIQNKIEQMQLVESAIDRTVDAIRKSHDIDWSQMLDLIHLTNHENRVHKQYQDASNISARIRLHKHFSANPTGWFPWLFEHCRIHGEQHILEAGCGDGAFWYENTEKIPQKAHIILSDISEGMISDARRNIGKDDARFEFSLINCMDIPYEDHIFDRIIANHLLFYCDDLQKALAEIRRVLKPGGLFICSTYGPGHMKEIGSLVTEFDRRIILSDETLYEKFGLDNGYDILKKYFPQVSTEFYEDAIEINIAQPLIEYILSCHGNQNQYILDRYEDFRLFVEKKTKNGFHITKEAGIFICQI